MIGQMVPKAAAASRARGAMILAVFGTLWLLGALSLAAHFGRIGHRTLELAGAGGALVCAATLLFAWSTVRRLAPFAAPWPAAVRRGFWAVNIAQYVALSAVASLAGSGAHQRWLVPAGIGIVGLHFFPLARLFRSSAHAVIGAVMMIVAAAIVQADLPPLAPVGVLAGGAVLIAGAVLLTATARRAGRETRRGHGRS